MSTALVQRNNSTAMLLELLFGFVFQTFGIGHIYQGRVGMGLFIMGSYWALQILNALLCFVLIGFVTGPLTWLFYMVAAPMNAADLEAGY